MVYKYQYDTQDERQQLITDNAGKYLIEEQNITEGNFLIFSDDPPKVEIIYTEVPKADFDDLQQQNAQMLLALVNGGLM